MLDTTIVQALSSSDTISTELRLLKLIEEVGELSAAYLAEIQAPNRSSSAEANTLEEGTDVLVNILDVLYSLGHTDASINNMINLKTRKWARKIALNQ